MLEAMLEFTVRYSWLGKSAYSITLGQMEVGLVSYKKAEDRHDEVMKELVAGREAITEELAAVRAELAALRK